MIFNKLGRGVTVYNGKKGFGKRGMKEDSDIILPVYPFRSENKLTTELENCTNCIRGDAHGKRYQRRND